MPVSVVVIAKNEAKNLERCLRSLAWCDDVLVVDDYSTDNTREIAEQCGARVVSHVFEGFAAQRNWAMEHGQLQHLWVLHLDADEESTPEFAGMVRRAAERATATTAAYALCRKTMLQGHWLRYSDGFPVWIMRLVRRDAAQFVESGHGEVPIPPVKGEVGRLREPFLHHAFSKGLTDWLARHNRYSTREAQLEFQERESLAWSHLCAGDAAKRRRALRGLSRRLPCRSFLRFIYQYAFKRGFLDGRAGLTFCWLMAMYEGFIVEKRRELERGS